MSNIAIKEDNGTKRMYNLMALADKKLKEVNINQNNITGSIRDVIISKEELALKESNIASVSFLIERINKLYSIVNLYKIDKLKGSFNNLLIKLSSILNDANINTKMSNVNSIEKTINELSSELRKEVENAKKSFDIAKMKEKEIAYKAAVERGNSMVKKIVEKDSFYDLLKGISTNEYSIQILNDHFINWVLPRFNKWLPKKENYFPFNILGTKMEDYVNLYKSKEELVSFGSPNSLFMVYIIGNYLKKLEITNKIFYMTSQEVSDLLNNLLITLKAYYYVFFSMYRESARKFSKYNESKFYEDLKRLLSNKGFLDLLFVNSNKLVINFSNEQEIVNSRLYNDLIKGKTSAKKIKEEAPASRKDEAPAKESVRSAVSSLLKDLYKPKSGINSLTKPPWMSDDDFEKWKERQKSISLSHNINKVLIPPTALEPSRAFSLKEALNGINKELQEAQINLIIKPLINNLTFNLDNLSNDLRQVNGLIEIFENLIIKVINKNVDLIKFNIQGYLSGLVGFISTEINSLKVLERLKVQENDIVKTANNQIENFNKLMYNTKITCSSLLTLFEALVTVLGYDIGDFRELLKEVKANSNRLINVKASPSEKFDYISKSINSSSEIIKNLWSIMNSYVEIIDKTGSASSSILNLNYRLLLDRFVKNHNRNISLINKNNELAVFKDTMQNQTRLLEENVSNIGKSGVSKATPADWKRLAFEVKRVQEQISTNKPKIKA